MVGTVAITAHLYDDNCMFVDVDNTYDTSYAYIWKLSLPTVFSMLIPCFSIL